MHVQSGDLLRRGLKPVDSAPDENRRSTNRANGYVETCSWLAERSPPVVTVAKRESAPAHVHPQLQAHAGCVSVTRLELVPKHRGAIACTPLSRSALRHV